MSPRFSGFDLWYSAVRDAASVGDTVTITAEKSGRRGFSASEIKDTGTVTEVSEYELRVEPTDADYELQVTKSGIAVLVTRHLTNDGTFSYEADEVVVR